jgi:hypothetical protein
MSIAVNLPDNTLILSSTTTPTNPIYYDYEKYYIKYDYTLYCRSISGYIPVNVYNADIIPQNIAKVAYYMENNGIWAWVSFDYNSVTMSHYDIPTGGSVSNVFTNSMQLKNMNVISNSPNVTNVQGITGYIQTWPSGYNPPSGTTVYGLYNLGYSTGINYGAFNLWNLATGDCILAWNGVLSSTNKNIGFGNGTGYHKDWTFQATTIVNFKFRIFAQVLTTISGYINKFQSSNIYGNFNNIDYLGTNKLYPISINANGYFQRNLSISGNIYCSNNINNIPLNYFNGLTSNIQNQIDTNNIYATNSINSLSGKIYYNSNYELNLINTNNIYATNSINSLSGLIYINSNLLNLINTNNTYATNSINSLSGLIYTNNNNSLNLINTNNIYATNSINSLSGKINNIIPVTNYIKTIANDIYLYNNIGKTYLQSNNNNAFLDVSGNFYLLQGSLTIPNLTCSTNANLNVLNLTGNGNFISINIAGGIYGYYGGINVYQIVPDTTNLLIKHVNSGSIYLQTAAGTKSCIMSNDGNFYLNQGTLVTPQINCSGQIYFGIGQLYNDTVNISFRNTNSTGSTYMQSNNGTKHLILDNAGNLSLPQGSFTTQGNINITAINVNGGIYLYNGGTSGGTSGGTNTMQIVCDSVNAQLINVASTGSIYFRTSSTKTALLGYDGNFYLSQGTMIVPQINCSGQGYFGTNCQIYTNTADISFRNTNSTGSVYIQCNNGSSSAYLDVAGVFHSNQINVASDYRLKTDIKIIDEYSCLNLNPVQYIMDNKQSIGLIAHELQEQIPMLVDGVKDGDVMQSVNYIGLIPILIRDIQKLNSKIMELENKLYNLI